MSEYAGAWYTDPRILQREGREAMAHFFEAFAAASHDQNPGRPDPALPEAEYFREVARILEGYRRRQWLSRRRLGVEVRVPGLTLEPLREQGPDALDPGGVPGIVRITLCEIRIIHHNGQCHTRTCEADDLFHAEGDAEPRRVPRAGRLTRATLRVQFADSTTPRLVVLCPPQTVQLMQVEDEGLVRQWLERRGFVGGVMRDA